MSSPREYPTCDRRNLYFTYFAVALTTAGAGMHFAWMTVAIYRFLRKEGFIELSKQEVSYMPMFPFAGYLIGSPACAAFLDRIGRKKSSLIAILVQLLAWVMVIVATKPWMVFLSRFLVGLSSGVMHTTNQAYLGEVAETAIRGFICSASLVGYFAGMIINDLYDLYLPLKHTAAFSSLVQVLYVFLYWWIPESPYYLLLRGKREEASKSLRFLRRNRYEEKELDDMGAAVERQAQEHGSCKDLLCVKEIRKRLLIVVAADSLQMFAGVGPINVYIFKILKQAGVYIPMNICVISMIMTEAGSVFVGSKLADMFGRKIVVVVANSFGILFLLGLGSYFHMKAAGYDITRYSPIFVLLILLYFASAGGGLIQVPFLLRGELFSVKTKAKALTFLMVYRASMFAISAKLYFQLWELLDFQGCFYSFAAFCALGILYAIFILPETRGRTLEEIQLNLRDSSHN